ncbi:MAG: bacteriohemerythrin [Xanthomonadales bacterium]|jgi:hemerythrin-like metal-binding protein|nr:bacteriohemerythrin [Xanthomonadales bacterium]
MPFFEWTPALSVGLETVDRQHRMLIGYINELDDAVQQHRAPDALRRIMAGLRNYTRVHFTFEEGLFKVYGYEAAHDHAAGHAAFVRMLEQFESRQTGGDAAVARELLDFLKHWLSDHILVEDVAYAKVLIPRGAR